jgi:hypothetical protein
LIKRELAARHGGDMDAYYAIKDPVCDLIWEAAREWGAGHALAGRDYADYAAQSGRWEPAPRNFRLANGTHSWYRQVMVKVRVNVETMTTPDPVIDEIRETRHRISAMCDHDPRKLVAYFQEVQRQYADRVLTAPRAVRPTDAQSDVRHPTASAASPRSSTQVPKL